RIKKLQSVLGDHQDSVIARQVERELGMGAHLADENAFTYGLLFGRDACDGERLQAQADRVWKRASRPRYRRWMGWRGPGPRLVAWVRWRGPGDDGRAAGAALCDRAESAPAAPTSATLVSTRGIRSRIHVISSTSGTRRPQTPKTTKSRRLSMWS